MSVIELHLPREIAGTQTFGAIHCVPSTYIRGVSRAVESATTDAWPTRMSEDHFYKWRVFRLLFFKNMHYS